MSHGGLLFILSFLFAMPLLVCLMVDLKINGGVDWSGYVAFGLLAAYLIGVPAALVPAAQSRGVLPRRHGGAAGSGAVCVPEDGRALVSAVCLPDGRRGLCARRDRDRAAALCRGRAAAPGAVHPRRRVDRAGGAVRAGGVSAARQLRHPDALVVAVSARGAHAAGPLRSGCRAFWPRRSARPGSWGGRWR